MRFDDVIDRAVTLAHKSTMTQRHGAVIVKNGEIIGEGYNHHAQYMCHSWSCHAEVDAIMSLRSKDRKQLNDATLIVVRVGGKGGNQIKHSKPCEGCKKAIEKAGIKRVFYSVE